MIARRRITIGTANASQAAALHALISANLVEGHLLPRTLAELTAHAGRFVIALRGRRIIGCAELAPLSPLVAEVRSLAVDESARLAGVGTMLVDELRQRARREGFDKLCAFTHVPGYFIQKGFSIVPHLWIPEKVLSDCVKCPHFQRCGQYAMVLPLDGSMSESTGDTVSDSAMVSRHL
jgi:N-acetylglutamate synthase-like GNAT family acetyltransferase